VFEAQSRLQNYNIFLELTTKIDEISKKLSLSHFLLLLLQRKIDKITAMEFKKTAIEGVYVIEPRVFNDARGYFFEAWKKEEIEKNIGKIDFIQDNESKSSYGVLRGLHYQKGEFSQAKLVRVIKGKVLDVAVDIRKSSPTFGKYVMVELSDENKRQFFIPRGFAHGFLVLSDEAIFTYKVDNVYAPQTEAGIRWNDPDVGIEWPIDPKDVLTSEKDLVQPFLRDAEVFE
jgi:dTDP-4-dehydrorhamnose 3,5-epimerase